MGLSRAGHQAQVKAVAPSGGLVLGMDLHFLNLGLQSPPLNKDITSSHKRNCFCWVVLDSLRFGSFNLSNVLDWVEFLNKQILT